MILTFRSKFCSFSSWTNTKVKCEWLTIHRKFGTVRFSITSTLACKKDSTYASEAVLSTTLETRATKGLLVWDLGQISRDFPSPAFWLKTWCLMKWAPKTSSRSSNWQSLTLLCTQWWSRGSRTRICRTSQSAIWAASTRSQRKSTLTKSIGSESAYLGTNSPQVQTMWKISWEFATTKAVNHALPTAKLSKKVKHWSSHCLFSSKTSQISKVTKSMSAIWWIAQLMGLKVCFREWPLQICSRTNKARPRSSKCWCNCSDSMST